MMYRSDVARIQLNTLNRYRDHPNTPETVSAISLMENACESCSAGRLRSQFRKDHATTTTAAANTWLETTAAGADIATKTSTIRNGTCNALLSDIARAIAR